MSSLPDLVSDNKLETSFDDKFTIHHYDDSDGEEHRRSNQRSEYWEEGEQLGEGGFGDILLQRCVKGKHAQELRAVKKIAWSRAKQFNYVSELEIIAKFSHRRYSRCFVKLLGWYDTNDHLFIAMEYFPLGDLQQYMGKTGPMREADVCVVISQVLEGLHYMHRENIAHRDIKPANVLVKSQPPQREWWVKLSDFGISKRIRGSTGIMSTVKGTWPYMAPELLNHEHGSVIQFDIRAADMWSLGEMAHRMLTATATFSSPAALYNYMIWPDKLPFHKLTEHGVSGDVESFIRAVMKPTPEHRLTSNKALEHTWIQPSNVNFAPLRTSTPAFNDNTPIVRTGQSLNSWATVSSALSEVEPERDRQPQEAGSSATTKPAPDGDGKSAIRAIRVGKPKSTGGIKNTRLLASGSLDKTVKIWDPATGQCVSTLKGHSRAVWSVAWSPDKAQLASGSCDKTIRIWDLATGQCVLTLKGHSWKVLSAAWSHDTARLASGSNDGTIKICDPATRQCVLTLEGHNGRVRSVAWSPDTARLASGSLDGTIKIWDPATRQCVSTLEGHTLGVWSVAWSPDTARLASGSFDNTIKIWDPATGQCVSTLEGHAREVWSVAWSPDTARLASGSFDNTIKIWDPATGQCVSTLEGHTECVTLVAWS